MEMRDFTGDIFRDLLKSDPGFVVKAFGGETEDGTTIEPLAVPLTLVEVIDGKPLEGFIPEDGSTPRTPFTLVFEGKKVEETNPEDAAPALPSDSYEAENKTLGSIPHLFLCPDPTLYDKEDVSKGMCEWTRRFVAQFS